jgi:hypothetical protein
MLSSFRRRLAALVCAVFLAGPAQAQDALSDFFGSIFGGRNANAQRESRPRIKPASAPGWADRQARAKRARAAQARQAQRRAQDQATQAQTPPGGRQAAPSFVVAVIGDSEASRLADGLEEAFAGDARVSIVDRTSEDSGLVRDDVYDWRKAAKALLDGPQHFDLVVMQVGINDNQKLRLAPDNDLAPLSQPFNEAYAARVEEIADAFRDKNVPFIWVGLPIMRSPTLSNAVMVFNDIAKQRATAAGARYVDLWEAFSDVDSVYKASGPDVNGAIVRLRGPDGVHFNDAGARKAAHFVEPEIKKVLEAKLQPQPEPGSPTPGSDNPAASVPGEPPPAPAPAPEKPLAGAVIPLNGPVLSPGGALAKLPAVRAPQTAAAPAQPGRADDFTWPKNPGQSQN